MNLNAADFAHFLAGVHGHSPFPWQQRLVNDLASSNAWPDVLNLPTSAGKTAALDAAVFHLALRADEPQRAALRICLVVDRRLVVDDAHARAEKLAAALAHPERIRNIEHRRVINEVVQRLASLAENRTRPLVVQRLRGGTPLETEWVRTPTQPVILCSTVDQVGSRLLFRGYGVSARMRPIHAGLLGCNTLVLVDEAHLSQPFLQTLKGVQAMGQARIKLAVLSATPGSRSGRQLHLSDSDRHNAVLNRRLTAAKPARLVKAPPKAAPPVVFRERATAMMSSLTADGIKAPAVAVIVNRVQLAREVFDQLNGSDSKVILLIGRCRSVERDRIVQDCLAPFRTGSESRTTAMPLFMVTTQCLEVGVDVDLDGLVTQVAPLDALRQRFGRLNRDGRDISVGADVVALPQDLAKAKPDPVYGHCMRETWTALNELAQEGVVDFGIESFDSLVRSLDTETLISPRTDAPVLMPAYFDLWASTSPVPSADPDIGLFLHGKEPKSADVSIVWRADINGHDIHEHGEALARLMALVPPRSTESVAVPLWAARAFLDRRSADFRSVADVPDGEAEIAPGRASDIRTAFRWSGSDDQHTGPISGADIRPGDLLVVSAQRGGCDEFGWNPTSPSVVRDVADEAAGAYARSRFPVRVSRDIADSDAEWERIVEALSGEVHGPDIRNLLDRVLSALPDDPATIDENGPAETRREIRPLLQALRDAPGRIGLHRYDQELSSAGGAILVATKGLAHGSNGAVPDSTPSTEDDTQSNNADGYVSLDRHSNDVEAIARNTASALGLKSVAEDVALAAYLHDAGKADRRFQVMLAGGDEWNMPETEPMAKSAKGLPGAWGRARLPDGWRHEAQSVRMACAHPRFDEAHDPELVLWLIGTHHGLGRPFFAFVENDPEPDLLPCLDVTSWHPSISGPETLAFSHLGKSWSNLFESLKRRYGRWGLAHLEAIVRLADHRASEGAAP